jgi:hypothetical protein
MTLGELFLRILLVWLCLRWGAAETTTQSGEEHFYLAGKEEQDPGKEGKDYCQHLEEHPAGIWIDVCSRGKKSVCQRGD